MEDVLKLLGKTDIKKVSMSWGEQGGRWQETPILGGFHRGLFFLGQTGYRHNQLQGGVGNYYMGYSWTSSLMRLYPPLGISYDSRYAVVYVQSGGEKTNDKASPVRCVSDLIMTTDKTNNTVPAASSTIKVSITGLYGQSWTLSEVSDSDDAFSGPVSGTGDTFNVNVRSSAVFNPQRSAKYKITTDLGMTSEITLYQDAAKDLNMVIKIGDLYWAKGNLVAEGSNYCKIGGPTDGGLYFQFGSLVGWSTSGSSPTIAVRSKGYTATPGWNDCPRYTDGRGINDIVPIPGEPSTGIGDACRTYLGGKWRSPTPVEFVALDETGSSWQSSPAGRTFSPESSGLFFPAAGYRSDNSLHDVGSIGGYRSASVNGALGGYYLYFNSSTVSPQHTDIRSTGLPVRCVSEP